MTISFRSSSEKKELENKVKVLFKSSFWMKRCGGRQEARGNNRISLDVELATWADINGAHL